MSNYKWIVEELLQTFHCFRKNVKFSTRVVWKSVNDFFNTILLLECRDGDFLKHFPQQFWKNEVVLVFLGRLNFFNGNVKSFINMKVSKLWFKNKISQALKQNSIMTHI
jgi:hypothetical protein